MTNINCETVHSLTKKHYALGVYCVYILIVTGIYNLTMELFTKLAHAFESTTIITAISLFIYTVLFMRMIKKTGYPLEVFGFTTKNSLRLTLEAICISIIFCFIITLLKWYLISYTEMFSGLTLFKIQHSHKLFGKYWIPLLYILFVPFQVFLAQGVIQSSLLEFLPQENRKWLSVVVSSLLFSAFHIELNVVFALGVLIPGVMWSILYLRHRTLISITISHIIIGFWGLFLLDYQHIFKIIYAHL